MSIVGVAAVPANAQPAAKAVAHLITKNDGGFGVVREILDAILEERAQHNPQGALQEQNG